MPVLFGGKMISSFGFGLGHTIGPVFVAEIVPNEIRGLALALVNTMIVVGQWSCALGFYVASGRTDDWAWRAPLLSQLIPPITLFLIAAPLLPESPSWLVLKGKRDVAKTSLKIFVGLDFDADTAVTTLEAAIQQESQLNKAQVNYLDCFNGTNRRRTTIIVMVYLAQQFIGCYFVVDYLPYYFTIAGVKNPIGIAQIAYAIQLIGNIASWPLIDRLGRRILIVYGCICMTCALLVIGGVSCLPNTPSVLKAIVALMAIWGFLYQATLGATAYSVGGETPAARVRQKTYAVNIVTSTAAACLISQVLPYLINPGNANLGGKVAFVFFAPSALLSIYLWFCLPELNGRNYLEIEEMFQKRLRARKFRNYVCSQVVLPAHDSEDAKTVVHEEHVEV